MDQREAQIIAKLVDNLCMALTFIAIFLFCVWVAFGIMSCAVEIACLDGGHAVKECES